MKTAAPKNDPNNDQDLKCHLGIVIPTDMHVSIDFFFSRDLPMVTARKIYLKVYN